MKKTIIKLYWKLRIFLLALRWIKKVNLGDKVVYCGNVYVVANGVMSNSWRLSHLENGNDGWVKRIECKKVLSVSNLVGSFRNGWDFYMGYWFDIWVAKGIEPWMRKCKIW